MNFLILSRIKARKLSYSELETDCVIISITDVHEPPVQFAPNPHIKDVLRLRFLDTDADVPGAMQADDAAHIVDFVKQWKDRVPLTVVHCEAGVSRSAGVAAALCLWLGGSDVEVFENAEYVPNRRCYRLVLRHLYEQNEL